MPDTEYSEEKFETLHGKLQTNIILLITATDVETKQLHKILKPFPGFDKIVMMYKGSLTYYLGVFGLYKVAHVQCSMGSVSRDSSIITTNEALDLLNAKIVIMPGIAFGVDSIKQQIGDVLVAEAVQPYNNKRVSQDGETSRAYAIHSSKLLLNRFKSLKSWEYLLADGSKAKASFSLVLSGEELIDNKQHRDELIDKFPTAQGGEMEGAGVYAACDNKANCILVKGICDFADGQKGKNKSVNQQIAIESALSLCLDLLSSKTAFSELGVESLSDTVEDDEFYTAEINEVLFEIYDPSKETYYLERTIDSQFNNIINHTGIWIHGVSGCGKSSVISRNLAKSNIPYIQVNLASCIDQPIEAYFNEILLEVASNIEGLQSITQSQSFSETVKSLLTVLNKKYANKDLIIFIEEIPLDTNEHHQEFAKKMYSLLVSKALIPSLVNVRFILSSINDPTTYIQSFNQKIYTQLKFVRLESWTSEEIDALFELINSKLRIKVSADFKKEVLSKSKRLPRFVKKFFRNVLFLTPIDSENMNEALIETERELNNL